MQSDGLSVNGKLPVDLHLRSYGPQPLGDRHAFAQIVLPVAGEVELDIEGRGRRLDLLHAAVVAPGAWHTQWGEAGNHSFILDLGPELLHRGPWQRLLERPFTPIGAAARKLVEFMSLARSGAAAPAQLQEPQEDGPAYDARFTFARLRYTFAADPAFGMGSRQMRDPPWRHDYPAAETNLMHIMTEVTSLTAFRDGGRIIELAPRFLTDHL